MSCSGSGPCTCAPGCPKPAGIANSLGFSGVGACCAAPCPSLPFHKLDVCLQLNRNTTATIQVGCRLGSSDPCEAYFPESRDYSSDGRDCQVVNFQRTVKDGALVRIVLCQKDCVPCGANPPLSTCGVPVLNKLLKFSVDGISYVPLLDLLGDQEVESTSSCTFVRCTASGACCDTEEVIVVSTSIPAGVTIQFGPVGEPVALL
jgi:hypothetical protein